MYKILKSMLAEFSYFIEKHFGITWPDAVRLSGSLL